MSYKIFVKKLRKCPFCILKKEEILKENKNAMLIVSRAPYTKDHLLVIPKKHILMVNKLSKNQKDDFEELVYYGLKKLHGKYSSVNILYREGKKKEVGKSISHLHYHLIPKIQIVVEEEGWEKRKVFSDKEYLKKTSSMKKSLKIK